MRDNDGHEQPDSIQALMQVASKLGALEQQLKVLEKKVNEPKGFDWQVWGSSALAGVIGIVGAVLGSYYTFVYTNKAEKIKAEKEYYSKCGTTIDGVKFQFRVYCYVGGGTVPPLLTNYLNDLVKLTSNYNPGEHDLVKQITHYQTTVSTDLVLMQNLDKDTASSMPIYRKVYPISDTLITNLDNELKKLDKE